MNSWVLVIAFCFSVWAVAAIILYPRAAYPHGWYNPACCSDQDCAPIPSNTVSATDEGWHVKLGPEHHFLVNTFVDTVVAYDKTKPSQDESFHACVHAQGPILEGQGLICLYVPLQGY